MLTIRAMSDGKGYSSRHLEHSDYYAEGERVVGRWMGRGAELLGLGGEVKSDDFEALRQGLDPETGKFLRQRKSADRVASDGTTRSHGRHLYDFTISAPKSVSIMAILGADKRLMDAHEKAVAEALQELEAHAATVGSRFAGYPMNFSPNTAGAAGNVTKPLTSLLPKKDASRPITKWPFSSANRAPTS